MRSNSFRARENIKFVLLMDDHVSMAKIFRLDMPFVERLKFLFNGSKFKFRVSYSKLK